MATERVLSNLNLISFKTEGGLQNHIDELQEGDLAFTPDNSLKGVLFDFKWADHLLNDMSWLLADTFSWHDGEMYKAAYNHLVTDFEGTTAETETIGDIEITYYRAEDRHKICLPDQEDKILALYNATGVAWYYILDTANKQFKLPRRHSQQIVRSVENADGSWYRLYADGWVEQGGRLTQSGSARLPIEMSNNNYNLQVRLDYNSTGTIQGVFWYATKTTTGFTMGNFSTDLPLDWQVRGPSAIDMSSFQDSEKYLYFYVGAFTQTAIENTAGLNTELFNGKAGVDLDNVSADGKAAAVGWGMPDYSAGVSASSTNTIAQTDIYVKSDVQTGNSSQIYINDVIVASGWEGFVCAYVPKGATFRVTGANAVYYPLKGVN